MRGWDERGQVLYEERWVDGKLNDLPDGTAAARRWDTSGRLIHEEHWVDGLHVRTGPPR